MSEPAEARAGEIISAFDVLGDNPLIGCPAGDDKHELLTGHGSRGYLALYRYLPLIDTALLLAIRAQRGGGTQACERGSRRPALREVNPPA